jgi:PAS domain S-box-containing protein
MKTGSFQNRMPNAGAQSESIEGQQNENTLTQSADRFMGILEIADDAIISVDAAQRIVLFNQGAEKVFGYKPNEVIGQPLDQLLPERFLQVHREHIQRFEQSPEASRLMGQRREVAGRRKNGVEFPAEASISRLDLGGEVLFTVILRDVTERKLLEARLRRSEQNLAEGQHLTKTGSWILDFQTGNTDWSVETCRIFGFSDPPPSPHYSEFRARVRLEDRDAVDRGLRESFETGEPRPLSYVFVLPDGTRKHIETVAKRFIDIDGGVKLMGTVMDVTERKRAEDAIRASAKWARGQADALASTLDALARESSSDRIVEHVLRTSISQLDAHSSSVWLRDPASGLMHFEFALENGAFKSKTNAALAAISPASSIEDIWPWPEVVRSGRPYVLEDIREQPAFPWRAHVLAQGVVSILIVPMLIAGKVEGVIGIRFTKTRVFVPEELELAQALAHQAMLAMQLNRLSAQSRQAAVLAERNRMARDLHDTLAQGFTGVIMQLEAAKGASAISDATAALAHIERAEALARSSLGEARRALHAMRSQLLVEGTLCTALDELIKRVTLSTELQAELVVEGESRVLPTEWEEGLLRITQEALTNTQKYAHARHFRATLAFLPQLVRLQLVDDGRGFDPRTEHEGFGLIGMNERAEQLAGNFILRSKPGEGTEIIIELSQASGGADYEIEQI